MKTTYYSDQSMNDGIKNYQGIIFDVLIDKADTIRIMRSPFRRLPLFWRMYGTDSDSDFVRSFNFIKPFMTKEEKIDENSYQYFKLSAEIKTYLSEFRDNFFSLIQLDKSKHFYAYSDFTLFSGDTFIVGQENSSGILLHLVQEQKDILTVKGINLEII